MFAPGQFSRRRLLQLGVGTSVLGAVGAGAGCAPVTPNSGAGSGGGAKTFTIYWNAGHAYKAYEAVIDQFGKDNDLEINWQKFQWPDLATKLTADFRSSNVPDLVEEAGAGTAIPYGIADNVLALDELAKADTAMNFPADYITAAVSARQHEGITYSIPLHLTANGLVFYNKQLLEAAGFSTAPTTWEEFSEATKAATRSGVFGTALNADPSYSAPFYYQQGVAYSSVTEKSFMQPEAAASKALTFMQDLIFADKVSPAPVATTDYSGPQKLFSAKRAATFVSGPWDLGPVRQGSADIDLGVAAPLTGSVRASAMAGSGVMIPAKAKNPDLSWQLLSKLTALDIELQVTKEVGMSMPRKSWATSPDITDDETLKVIATSLDVVADQDAALPATGKASQIADLYKTAYQQIVIQQKAVGPALAEFRTQAAALLA